MATTTITPPTYVTQSEELYDKGVNPQTATRLIAFTRPYMGRLILAAVLMLIASIASVMGPYFVKIAIDSGINSGNAILLRYTILAYLVVSVFQWIGTYYRVKIMAWVGQAIIYDVRKKIFIHLQELSLGFYSRYSVGRVITRAINDVETLRDFLTWAVLAIARDVFTLALIIFVMLDMICAWRCSLSASCPSWYSLPSSSGAPHGRPTERCERRYHGSTRSWQRM